MTGEKITDWIPNIVLGEDYDQRYADSLIHYETLGNLSGFFGHDMPIHRHAQFLQIHFIRSGRINFHIDDQLYQFSGPGCFMTPPATPHSFHIDSSADGHVLTIHEVLCWQLIKDGMAIESSFNFSQGICIDPARLETSQQGQWLLLTQLFQQIRTEWQADRTARSIAIEDYVRLILIQLIRFAKQDNQGTTVNNDELNFFRHFAKLIEDEFQHHHPLQYYAQILGVSESRLNGICQKIANRSPKKIIHDRLIQEAKRLITFNALSNSEICFRLGFSDPAYFSRFFKRQTGTTVQIYRKTNLNNMPS
ncbi:4-hydroxyphenylacetate catabolism regulatory protein HpaA [Pseudomaricurvus alcaniphilus]|nr:4-hydroxyphenylacetate catabolism regulatory protein HpaA [Pseudomaricurvus alcaniphilus]NHN39881.1 4-hydroxyphenylacetate catabolism regulatory protein HpaA [Pseudomaricurvus alcaniphilus]